MDIIPAIDLIDGQCIRLENGDFSTKKVYSSNPVDFAKKFEDAGLSRLHLVDLDGARAKAVRNLKVLEQIANATSLTIDFGGGVSDTETVRSVLSAGAAQVTAGSLAVRNPALVVDWIKQFGAKAIVIGADVKGRSIAINAWAETAPIDVDVFINGFVQAGAITVISTDVAMDGALMGTSLELYTYLIQQFPGLDIIASGGISSMADIHAVAEVGVAGVIVGKAIYEERVTLEELGNYVN